VPRLIKPRAVRDAATLGIAAPSGPVDPERFAAGCALLTDLGFGVVHRDDILDQESYLAGSDERRARELTELALDPRVDAIVCARGGYGCDRILDRLDPACFRAARKPVVGYSDVTALLLWLRRRAGLVGFHGPMLDRGRDVDASVWSELVAALRGRLEAPWRLRGTPLCGGSAEGRLLGGSLSMLLSSLGGPWEPDLRGAILLVEEIGERPYRIDRMFRQLAAGGKLAGVAGIGLGALTACEDERYPEASAIDVIESVVRPLGVPLVADLAFGHIRENRAWPMGLRATMDGDVGEIRIQGQWVSGV
jgi:muramoyltetrapeptide carboxypeptidase